MLVDLAPLAPKLSPDGKFLTYLAPNSDGVLNVFVRNTADENNDNARMVTNDTSRGIRQYQWAPDSETLLFLQDFEVSLCPMSHGHILQFSLHSDFP